MRVEEAELRQMEIILPMAKMLAGGAAEHDLDRDAALYGDVASSSCSGSRSDSSNVCSLLVYWC